ncbi:coiled-coil domain-containing protein 158-like [Polyodon spathula]|uniref:coiled-coil domain-containing protein 158-like n=1 Tax=Polyodon spathula TaxID=7913 RepID=UPI001B7EB267|nr:coiled-coil domain-containing protein 158-like [Polyodon spathula]
MMSSDYPRENDTSFVTNGFSLSTGSGMQVGVSVLGSSVHETPTKSAAPKSIGSTSTGNKSLDELRQHLERQTRETQRLQEEVEQATKLTMERMGRSLGGTSHEQPVSLNRSVENSLNAQDISVSNHERPYSKNSMTYRPEPAATGRSISFPGKEHLERALEEYSLQVKELQMRLSEAHELNEQQKFYFHQSSVELQTKLQEVQLERACQADIRKRESKAQGDLISKLQVTLEEATIRTEQQQQKSEMQEMVLQEVRSSLLSYQERSGRKVYEHEDIGSMPSHNLGSAVGKVLHDIEAEVSCLKEELLPMEDQLDTLKLESQTKGDIIIKQHQERVQELILSHEQEVAALTDKLNQSHSNAVSIQKQLAIVQEQAANQNVMYLRQLTELESTVSQLRSELREAKRMYEDKVCAQHNCVFLSLSRKGERCIRCHLQIEDLEKKLILAYSEAESARREWDEYSRDSGDLDMQLQQLMSDLRKTREELNMEKEQNKRLWERESGNSITVDNLRRELDGRSMEAQRMETLIKSMKEECRVLIDRQLASEQDKNEVLEKASSLKSQLNATKEQLQKITESHRVSQEKTRQLETTLAQMERALEENHRERRNLQLNLEKRSQEVQLKQTEIEHYQENLEKGLGSLQTMKVEAETLKLKLNEREKMVELVREQMDNVTKLVGQHSRNAELMHSEKTQLQNELSERKIDIQRLKAAVEKQEERVGELVTRDSEKEQLLKAFTLEKEKLTARLEGKDRELARLTEQHEALKKSHCSKMKEMENATARLNSQLRNANAELEKTKRTLKTLEGADGHAVKVAMGMQKQITAKRGQIDALQSRIHFLEETVENIAKARRSQLSKRKIPFDLTALLNLLCFDRSLLYFSKKSCCLFIFFFFFFIACLLQEKRFMKSEINRLNLELTSVSAEKKKLMTEVEAVQSLEKHLREKVIRLEDALSKACDRFAECQVGIQQQEQECMRLKLQHALDVKELQVPKYRTSQPLSAYTANLPSSQLTSGYLSAPKTTVVQADPAHDIKKLLKELRSMIQEDRNVSAPAKNSTDVETPASPWGNKDATRDVTKDTGGRSVRFSRDPPSLHTVDLEDELSLNTLGPEGFEPSFICVAPRFTSSPRKHSPETRSPVHSLLTAPLSSRPQQPGRSGGAPMEEVSIGHQQVEMTGQACVKLQGRLDSLQNLVEDLQIKNKEMSSMIQSQEKRIKKVKDREKLSTN